FDVQDGRVSETVLIRRPLSPPQILPHERAFTDSQVVTIVSETPEAEIHYTLDGTSPTRSSPRYTGPFRIDATAAIQARAYRPGVQEIPFAASGIDASAISYGRFE